MESSNNIRVEKIRVLMESDSQRPENESRPLQPIKFDDQARIPINQTDAGPRIIECIRNLRVPQNSHRKPSIDPSIEMLELQIKWVDCDESLNSWDNLASFSNPQMMVKLLDQLEKNTPKNWRGLSRMKRLKLLERARAYFMRKQDMTGALEDPDDSKLGITSFIEDSKLVQSHLEDCSPAKTDLQVSRVLIEKPNHDSEVNPTFFGVLDHAKKEHSEKDRPKPSYSPLGSHIILDPRQRNRQPLATLSASPQPRQRSPSEPKLAVDTIKHEPKTPICAPTPPVSTRFESDRSQLGQRMIVTSAAKPPTPSRPGSPSPVNSYYADEQSMFPYLAFEDSALRQLLSCLCSTLIPKTSCNSLCRNCNSCTCGQRRKLAKVAALGLTLPPTTPKNPDTLEPHFAYYFCPDTGLPVFILSPSCPSAPSKSPGQTTAHPPSPEQLHLSAADTLRLHPEWTQQALAAVDRHLCALLRTRDRTGEPHVGRVLGGLRLVARG